MIEDNVRPRRVGGDGSHSTARRGQGGTGASGLGPKPKATGSRVAGPRPPASRAGQPGK